MNIAKQFAFGLASVVLITGVEMATCANIFAVATPMKKLTQMTRVQVNGIDIVDSQIPEKVLEATKNYLQEDIHIQPKSEFKLVVNSKQVAKPKVMQVKKLPQMTRVLVNGNALVDSQVPEIILNAIKGNIGKKIEIKPRVK
jgi:uncharacterized protein (DUF427 family)